MNPRTSVRPRHRASTESLLSTGKLCKYKIVDIREMPQKYWINSPVPNRKNFLYATLIKTADNFPSKEEFSKISHELGDYK